MDTMKIKYGRKNNRLYTKLWDELESQLIGYDPNRVRNTIFYQFIDSADWQFQIRSDLRDMYNIQ